MAYASWSVVFGEQPSAAKWNILGTNDASFNDGTGLNAGSVQQIVTFETGTMATGTTLIPMDNTIPQNTEGDQYMSLAITPKASANALVISVVAMFCTGNAAANNIVSALFQDSTASALASMSTQVGGQGAGVFNYSHKMTAGTTSATTFKVRCGSQLAGTSTFNGIGGAQYLGGSYASSIIITEHKV